MRNVASVVVLLVIAVAVVAQEAQPDALAAYREGRLNEAVTITMAELDRNPNNIESYVVLGWALNAQGRYQDAIDYGLRGLQVSRFEHRIIQIVAEAQVKLGNIPEALGYLEQYVQVAPTGSFIDWVYYAMGEIFIGYGQYHRADIALSTSVYHNGRIPERWNRLGYAREQLGDWTEALQAYDRAIQLRPDYGDAIRGRQRVRAQL